MGPALLHPHPFLEYALYWTIALADGRRRTFGSASSADANADVARVSSYSEEGAFVLGMVNVYFVGVRRRTKEDSGGGSGVQSADTLLVTAKIFRDNLRSGGNLFRDRVPHVGVYVRHPRR